MLPKTIAIRAVRAAAKIILQYYTKEKTIHYKDALRNDIVTSADLHSEKKIVSIIQNAFPSHNILAEEKHSTQQGSPYTWLIDPIDGTGNYSKQIPLFMTAIGLLKNNIPILSVAYDPLRNELFVAEKGKGAYLNNKRIHVSHTPFDNTATVTLAWQRRFGVPPFLHALYQAPAKIIVLRSAITQQCYVACGRIDAMIDKGDHPWDYSAALLITEAGGTTTDLSGNPFTIDQNELLASNSILHHDLVTLIKKHTPL